MSDTTSYFEAVTTSDVVFESETSCRRDGLILCYDSLWTRGCPYHRLTAEGLFAPRPAAGEAGEEVVCCGIVGYLLSVVP